jgi:hypothetical protein
VSFYKRYELVQLIHEDEVRTFSGFQNTTRCPGAPQLPGVLATRPTIIRQAEVPVTSPACSALQRRLRPRQHSIPNRRPGKTN